MLKTLAGLWKKYKAPILYLFFGGVTTVINIAVYYILYYAVGVSNDLSNIISWIITVTVAYITNKLWVFESRDTGTKTLLREITSFFGCRAATGVMDLAIMHIGVDMLSYPAFLLKIISNIIVIILNYVASKLIIFKKGDPNG